MLRFAVIVLSFACQWMSIPAQASEPQISMNLPLDLVWRGDQPAAAAKVNVTAPGDTILVSIRSNSPLFTEWAKKRCDEAGDLFSRILEKPAKIDCVYRFSDEGPSALPQLAAAAAQELKKSFRLHLDIQKNLDGGLSLTLRDPSQKDPLVKSMVGWKLGRSELTDELDDKLAGAIFVFSKMEAVKEALVELALETEHSELNPQALEKMSLAEKMSLMKSGSALTQRDRDFLTAGTQLIATLGIGWYGYHYLSTNAQDFDYGNFKGTLKNKLRFGNMFRYDDNSFATNYNHTYAGVTYYLICRGNGLTALESYLCSMAGSLAWETMVEWREVWSINDQIFTGHAGAVVGESIFQMGRYLFAKGPRWLRKSLGWAWQGPQDFSTWLNAKAFGGRRVEEIDEDMAGHFNIEFGILKSNKRPDEKYVSIDNSVVRIPLYDEPGSDSGFLTDVVETQFNFTGPLKDLVGQQKVFAKLVFAAYTQKKLTEGPNGRLRGYQLYVGPSSAFELNRDRNFYNDFYAIAHVLGGTVKIDTFHKGFKVTTTFDVWGDAVMMHSMAIEDYKTANPGAGLVHNLQNADYYHGWGVTSRGQVIVEFDNGWAVGGQASTTHAVNTNGRQRDLGDVNTLLNLNDQIVDTSVFVERAVTQSLKVRLTVGTHKRSGSIAGYGTRTQSERRTQIAIVYHF